MNFEHWHSFIYILPVQVCVIKYMNYKIKLWPPDLKCSVDTSELVSLYRTGTQIDENADNSHDFMVNCEVVLFYMNFFFFIEIT